MTTGDEPRCSACGQVVTQESRHAPWRHVTVPKDRHGVQRVIRIRD